MRNYKFTITDLNSLFNGLDVEVGEETLEQCEDGCEDGTDCDCRWYEIINMRDRNFLLGDRNFSIQLQKNSLMIHSKFLKKCEFSDVIEYATDSNYGDFISELSYRKDNLELVACCFENCVQVSVLEKQDKTNKTLWTRNFFDAHDDIWKYINKKVCLTVDIEEILFELKHEDSSI